MTSLNCSTKTELEKNSVRSFRIKISVQNTAATILVFCLFFVHLRNCLQNAKNVFCHNKHASFLLFCRTTNALAFSDEALLFGGELVFDFFVLVQVDGLKNVRRKESVNFCLSFNGQNCCYRDSM